MIETRLSLATPIDHDCSTPARLVNRCLWEDRRFGRPIPVIASGVTEDEMPLMSYGTTPCWLCFCGISLRQQLLGVKFRHDFVGDIEIGRDILHVVVVVESFHEAEDFAGGARIEIDRFLGEAC